MLSKLTFSLALVLMLAFVATPAMAQTRSVDLNVAAIPAKGAFTVISKADGMLILVIS